MSQQTAYEKFRDEAKDYKELRDYFELHPGAEKALDKYLAKYFADAWEDIKLRHLGLQISMGSLLIMLSFVLGMYIGPFLLHN